jgi:cellulose synthase/poly-beta-1,6-N-acetylglucosamine synthase-like glycosyltransferase
MFAHTFTTFNNRFLREAVSGDGAGLAVVFALAAVYALVLVLLSVYGSHRYTLLWRWFKTRREPQLPLRRFDDSELPGVTVQLPLFNERYVVEALLDAVCAIDYPKDRLQIQVLDDSTDDTTVIAAECVATWRSRGVDIVLLHRTDRSGFKAGALDAGLRSAKFGIVAIFDADFRPTSDFLRRSVHHFSDSRVAVVQGRWGHENADDSALTRVQAMMLDGHFLVEHPARARTGRFFNFNGTAGLWRLEAIADAGGWHAETLTEDLDLSYRAQLRGWKFVYDPDLVVPAELPVEMNAFKTQQHRWAKGSIQVMRKVLPAVMRSDQPFHVKSEAFLHLTGNMAYPLMAVMCLLTLPMLVARTRLADGTVGMIVDAMLFLTATASVIAFYAVGQFAGYRDWKSRLIALPALLAVGIGLTVNQTKAVIEALFGHQSEFVRTPKFAVKAGASWGSRLYRGSRGLVAFAELVLAVYFTISVLYAVNEGLWGSIPFLLIFVGGFWYVALMSFFQGRAATAPTPSSAKPAVA